MVGSTCGVVRSTLSSVGDWIDFCKVAYATSALRGYDKRVPLGSYVALRFFDAFDDEHSAVERRGDGRLV